MSGFRSSGSRADKADVERRLATATRGAELLDRKQRILRLAIDGLQEEADAARLAWQEQARRAAVWLQRAAGLDGDDRIMEAAPDGTARVTVRWGGAMGISYPQGAECLLPESSPTGGSSALAFAAAAHREALQSAVAAASAERALLLVSSELLATRTRQRAVENRWIPLLQDQLAEIARRIAEQELEESLRLRWSAGLV
ncbi:V-type ATP synthase subunit D [Arthrobacter gengyunqii]|uniref:V-type ATP synthase subunit D n=1 Tax=Arthrobacter gengyunqii TaxID=2886940 RepID=A0A9X1S695_9MICC|nr:V-type ATP synthase subunit D [Arthrobacter gengyunqii]MCC3270310.1 V-type ATP synthase subunit D [Arthrobacter gengyunqii]UOY97505.1 V-type ATP synthase subunit D [Arthrobacter gengyunqii]